MPLSCDPVRLAPFAPSCNWMHSSVAMALPERFHFNARLPDQSGTRIAVTAKEAEHLLLEKLREDKEQEPSTLGQLAGLYLRNGDQASAGLYLQKLDALGKNADPEKQARVYLGLGCLMETKLDYHAAVVCYSKALEFAPTDRYVSYFVHN